MFGSGFARYILEVSVAPVPVQDKLFALIQVLLVLELLDLLFLVVGTNS